MLEFFNFYIDVNVHNIWLTLFNIYGVVKYQSLCVQESCQPVITAELVARYQQLVRQHGAGFWWTLSAHHPDRCLLRAGDHEAHGYNPSFIKVILLTPTYLP